MSELFTSLTQAKLALNGGTMPAMTPLSTHASSVLNPAFTIGQGALAEEYHLGLRCPACGEWRHVIKQHLDRAHADIGGAEGIRRLLGIPPGAKLVSRKASERISAHAASARTRMLRLHAEGRAGKSTSQSRSRTRGAKRTVGYRNLRNTCDAQLAQRFLSVRDKLRRQPSHAEFAEAEPQAAAAARRLYGTWNAFVATVGLKARRPGASLQSAEACEILRAWHRQHGTLPTATQVQRGDAAPLIPYRAVMHALSTDSWPEAMRRVASLLNIYGGRYGLPDVARASKKAS